MQNKLSLEGQNILITGVSRSIGIGAGLAKRFAEAGANIIIHGYPLYDEKMNYPDASKSFIEDFVRDLNSKGFNIQALPPSNLLHKEEPERIIHMANNIFGELTGLVINHAYSTSKSLKDWTPEHIDHHLSINVRAAMMLIHHFVKQHTHNIKAAITLFTSGQYLGPMPNEIAYAVSKEAIRGLSIQASAALAKENIRVNCVNPGPNDTGYLKGEEYKRIAKMFPSGKWGTPEDTANLLLFLHSEYGDWITGQVIASEGGFQR